MKHKFGFIATILAGVFLLFTPVFGSQENLAALDGGGSDTEVNGQSLGPYSWIRTWGEPGDCEVNQVVTDQDGNIYVIGVFKGTVDFDPGPEVDEHTSNGDLDFFLSKFDSSGDFIWTRTWGGTELERHLMIALDGVGGVYLAGDFSGSIDFDPGATVAQGVSNGETDFFLGKFDTQGNFKWVRTWGGGGYEFGCGVAADDSGQVYVTGVFKGDVDFDPGSGIAVASPEGANNGVSLSKFDSSGDFEWVRAWGGNEFPGDMYSDLCVDGNGDIYVSGAFSGTADFDPGPEIEQHTSNGVWDIFLSKFDSSGTFLWARTWGGRYDDVAGGVVIDDYGYIHVSGTCSTPDLALDAPSVGDGIDQPHSALALYSFLAMFDSSGNLRWAREWGGLGISICYDVAVDVSGNTYISESHQVSGGLGLMSEGFNTGERFASAAAKFDIVGKCQGYSIPGDAYGSAGLHLAVDKAGALYVSGIVSQTGNSNSQLLTGDHSDNANPGAFLIKLLE